jgi:hypothetical protein
MSPTDFNNFGSSKNKSSFWFIMGLGFNYYLNAIKRFLLKLILGSSTYEYMVRSILWDPRVRNDKLVDIIVMKDGVERRIEADWIKKIAKIIHTPEKEIEIANILGKYKENWMISRPTVKEEYTSYYGRPDYCKTCKIIKDIIE